MNKQHFETSTTTTKSQPALPSNAAPTDPENLETSILSICRQLLRTLDFGATDNFFEAGGDSLLAMRLALDIERQTGIKVDLQTIFATPTVRDICASLREPTEHKPVSICPIKSGSPRKLLYYIHGAFEFSALSDALPNDISIDFITINDPQWFHQLTRGKDTLTAIDQLCDAYAEAIMTRERPGSCCLAGCSAAGILAIETARKLEERGAPPDLVFIFDTYLHGPARRILHDIFYNGWLQKKMQQVLRLDRHKLTERARLLSREALSRMSLPDVLKASWMDPKDDLGLVFHDIRERISRAYRGPQCALKSHTVFFRATETREGRLMRADPNLGWARRLGRNLTVIPVPGDHFSLLTGDHARGLAKEMERQIRLHTEPI
jgi:thioesterase domain-containing protein/acyl carrier protein